MIAMERAGSDTYGFEPSGPFHDQAIKRVGMDPQRLRLGDMEKIKYGSASFDMITFSAVLEHLYDPSEAIGKAMQWLRSRGLIHVEVPSTYWLIDRIIDAGYQLKAWTMSGTGARCTRFSISSNSPCKVSMRTGKRSATGSRTTSTTFAGPTCLACSIPS